MDCGHVQPAPCFQEIEEVRCQNNCQKQLICGHICKGNCFKCFAGSLHESCQQDCQKLLPCGHRCKKLCGEYCGICIEKCEKRCKCGKTVCSRSCLERCDECPNKCSKPNSGEFSRFYKEFCDRMPYQIKCQKSLNCGHNCCGLFEENCSKICWKCLKNQKYQNFVFTFDCGHAFFLKDVDNHVKDYFKTNPFSIHSYENIPCLKCKQPIGKNLRYQDYSEFSILEIKNMEDLADLYLSKFDILTKQLIEFLKDDADRLRKKKSVKSLDNLSDLVSLLFNFDKKIKLALKFEHLFALKSYPVKAIKLQGKNIRKIRRDFARIELDYFNEELNFSPEGWQFLENKIQEVDDLISI